MWPFRKKQPKLEPKTVIAIVPDEHQIAVWQLWDSIKSSSTNRTEYYQFWKFVRDLFPEYKGMYMELQIEGYKAKFKVTLPDDQEITTTAERK